MAIFLSPAPVSLAAPVSPDNFSSKKIQGPANCSLIWTVYTSLAFSVEGYYGVLLCNISLFGEGSDIAFRIYVKTRYGRLSPHIVLFRGLWVVPWCVEKYKGIIPTYAWTSETIKYQAPLSVWLYEACLVVSKFNMEVNKDTLVNQSIQDGYQVLSALPSIPPYLRR